MREVVAYLARAIVDEPERVTVSELEGTRGLTYEVRAAPETSAADRPQRPHREGAASRGQGAGQA